MRELKIGDKVRIIPRHKADNLHKKPIYAYEMAKYSEQEFVIERLSPSGYAVYKGYLWREDWLEPVLDKSRVYYDLLGFEKVVVIPKTKEVRVFLNGKEVSVKQQNELEFDPVYGFLMAQQKYNAQSNTWLQNELSRLTGESDKKPIKSDEEEVVWVDAYGNKYTLKKLSDQYLKNVIRTIENSRFKGKFGQPENLKRLKAEAKNRKIFY